MKKYMRYVFLFAVISASGCEDSISPNRNGCLTIINNDGSEFVYKCVTKKQFDEKDPTVIPPSIFDVYQDVKWEVCGDCK